MRNNTEPKLYNKESGVLMNHRFSGKVAIVTGAGSGIGRASAIRLALEGASVVCVTISNSGKATAREITELGGESLFIQGDVSKEAVVKGIIKDTIDRYGKIDCLYNNAAITGDNQLVEEYPVETFERVIDTNLISQFMMMKYAIPYMPSGSAILNCASLHGTIGMAGDAAYSASKHAIIGLTKSVAAEVGPRNIRANVLAPGPVPTVMMGRYERLLSDDIEGLQSAIASGTALKRYGTADEIANFVCFLLSDEAGFITGTVHLIDGGYSATK
ncbi:Levodione reductase [Paenibacillus auburnensis]|uniref:Levodione reductase n=2 Tax=Paenibacillus auburnensis TaxID=2905649 RepID=A0ABN8FRT4_9BACL|nr:Levodione reductase [Paenibacillus auburnensis]